MVLAICVAVTFAVSVYLLLGRELKAVAMGVFLLGHAANLSILAMSGSPIVVPADEPAAVHQAASRETTGTIRARVKNAPISDHAFDEKLRDHSIGNPLDEMVDPLPQALILTAIVIGFAVMGFLLSLLVMTSRSVGTLVVDDLAGISRAPDDGPGTEGGAA